MFPFSGMHVNCPSSRTYHAGCGTIRFPNEGKRAKLEFCDARTGLTHKIRRVRKDCLKEHIVATLTAGTSSNEDVSNTPTDRSTELAERARYNCGRAARQK